MKRKTMQPGPGTVRWTARTLEQLTWQWEGQLRPGLEGLRRDVTRAGS